MSKQILSFLVCPISKQNLLPLAKKRSKQLYKALDQGSLSHKDGSVVSAQSKQVQFLITENKQHIYMVMDGLPIMIESKQIVFPG